MAEDVCLECGAEMPYDWAPCPNCGWKAPDAWNTDEDTSQKMGNLPGLLSKPRPWIGLTVWIVLGVLLLWLVLTLWRHN
jgi:hypothetical protein